MPMSISDPPPASCRFKRQTRWVAHIEAVVADDRDERSEFLGARDANHLAIEGLVLAAIGDHQLALRLLAGGDHGFAVGNRSGHRLFAQHMLAGLEAANGVFGVHAVGQHDVNDVDVGIVLQLVVGLVAVDVLRVDAITRAELGGLFGMPGNERDGLGMLAQGKRRKDLVDGERAESDDRVAELLAWGIGHAQLRRCRPQQSGRKAGSRNTLSYAREKAPPSELVIRHGITSL